MNVADFFELQCAFKGDRKVDTRVRGKARWCCARSAWRFPEFGRLA